MKSFFNSAAIFLFLFCLICFTDSCKKKPRIITLSTSAAFSITQTSAAAGGNISDDKGSASVIARGVCFCVSCFYCEIKSQDKRNHENN